MKMHYLQHEEFEDLAGIAHWAAKKGYAVSRTRFFAGDLLPALTDFDWLIIMGGDMSVHDEEQYSWLKEEKKFIAQVIAGGKTVLGICLGAQLIAHVLGGQVYPNEYKEIGWHPVALTAEGKRSAVFARFPHSFTTFHWHGDTFEVPLGAVLLASSEGCKNQAFSYQDRVIGLQFHLEMLDESIKNIFDHSSNELMTGRFVQQQEEILTKTAHLKTNEMLMTLLLDNLAGK